MSYIKNMFFDYLEQIESAEDHHMIETEMREMEEIIRDHSLPDYVVLKNGKRCYLCDSCDPMNEVCCC